MAEDIVKRVERWRWVLTKYGHDYVQINEMMRLQVADGLAAMRYGQFSSNNTPDPTSQAAFTSKRVVDDTGYGKEVIIWRDHRPEDDLAQQALDEQELEKITTRMDERRRRYMSANMDIRNRLDPTDWCRIHFHLQHYEGHRRYRGDLCSLCYRYKEANGHEPTATEVDYHQTHGRWPHKLYDPKSRKVV